MKNKFHRYDFENPPGDISDEDEMNIKSANLERFIKMVRSETFFVLDTETTGLTNRAEICQIAIIDHEGTPLLNTYVRPQRHIPGDATKIHGIRWSDVMSSPDWETVRGLVLDTIEGENVVVYNAVYDRRLMHQSDEALSLEKIEWGKLSKYFCAMEAFAEIYGEWNEYRGNYRWQPLNEALRHYKLESPAEAHTALADCQSTLAVCRAMLK